MYARIRGDTFVVTELPVVFFDVGELCYVMQFELACTVTLDRIDNSIYITLIGSSPPPYMQRFAAIHGVLVRFVGNDTLYFEVEGEYFEREPGTNSVIKEVDGSIACPLAITA